MQDYTNATTMTEPLRDYMTGNATPAIRDREELRVAPPIPTGEKPIAEMLDDALQIMSEAEKTLGTILRNMQKDEPGPPPDEEPQNLQHAVEQCTARAYAIKGMASRVMLLLFGEEERSNR